jgi:hypothetical protein
VYFGSGLAAAFDHRHGLIVARGHADVAAQGEHREPILGLAPPVMPKRGAEPDGESRSIDARDLRGEEVAELVHEDYDAEHQDRREPRHVIPQDIPEMVHTAAPMAALSTCPRAAESAARSDSRSVPG